MRDSSLSFRDLLLALAVVFVWGTNFVIIRLGLNALPPLLFASLRFTFVLLPLVFFLPRPKVPLANLAIYGLAIGLGQFGLLFIAMNGMISPGLASLVVQMQVFFTIALSMLRSGERLKPYQLAAFALAIAGMAVIMAHNGHGATIAGAGADHRRRGGLGDRQSMLEGSRQGERPRLCGVGQPVFAAAALSSVALARRLAGHRYRPRTRHACHLGRDPVAERRQHHVRLWRLGLAAGALSRRHRFAADAAGADIRHGRVGAAAGRAAGKLEDPGGTSGDGRAWRSTFSGAGAKPNSRPSRKTPRPSLYAPAPGTRHSGYGRRHAA